MLALACFAPPYALGVHFRSEHCPFLPRRNFRVPFQQVPAAAAAAGKSLATKKIVFVLGGPGSGKGTQVGPGPCWVSFARGYCMYASSTPRLYLEGVAVKLCHGPQSP